MHCVSLASVRQTYLKKSRDERLREKKENQDERLREKKESRDERLREGKEGNKVSQTLKAAGQR